MIQIPGFTTTTKRPGFYGATQFGVGPINLLSIPIVLLIVALKASAGGSITPDVDVVDINSKEDADTFCGSGGEAACMLYDALDEGIGFQLKAFCPAAAGGAVGATATITIVGAAVADGTRVYWLDGVSYTVQITNGMSIAQQATATRDAFLANPRASMLASAAAGVCTLTFKSLTVRGNQTVIYQDLSQDTSGVSSCTLAGSGAVTSSTNVTGVFAGATLGAGVETMTTTFTVLRNARYNRVAIAQNDATTLALWVTQTNSKASATEGKTEHLVFGANGTSAAAISLAQTTVNNQRFQCVWMKNSERAPSRMAAAMASVRAAAEGDNPNSSYDDHEFVTIPSQKFTSDWLDFATGETVLNAGVTPLQSATGLHATVVRSITTRSKDANGNADYRTLDTAWSVVPDWVRDDLKLLWTTDFKVKCKYVTPDPRPGQPQPDSDVATPTRWNTYVKSELRTLGDGPGGKKFLTQVEDPDNQPITEYNTVLQGLMTAVPIRVLPANHSQGLVVRQGNVVV